MTRVGFGYDIHPLRPERKLVLGGVKIPFSLGLAGHSDADVLCHAVGDAVLGAGALGDIGEHFPNTEDEYKDISSLLLLRKIQTIVREAGLEIVHIDATLVAEQPRITPYKQQMRTNIAEALAVAPDAVSVKATTSEGMDAVGTMKAIAAYAAATLRKRT